MTKEEIRQKAIECRRLRIDHCDSRKMRTKYWGEVCTNCEYYEPYAECTMIYAYEHGFADGVEEGKKQKILSKIDIDEQYEVSKKIEADIRADERKKVLEDVCGILADEIWNRAETHDDRLHNHWVRRCIALVESMRGEQT